MNKLNLGQEYKFSEGLVRYDIIGDGPPVVLVHGTPWSSFTWYKLAPVLAQRYRVHYYDLIGYGQSEKRNGQNVSLQSDPFTSPQKMWPRNIEEKRCKPRKVF